MANVQYYDVILKPVITEKSMDLMADKKYTFLVHTDATKNQIKEAVEKMFDGTKVKSVKDKLPEQRKGSKRAAECCLKVLTHVWEQEARGSSPRTPTMRSIIKGSEKVC